MLQKLKTIFPTLVEAPKQSSLDTESYLWFHYNEKQLIGVPKQDVSEKELLLLETFLNPYHVNDIPITKREEQWMDVLFHDGEPSQLTNSTIHTYRFVYFSLSDDDVDPIAFKEAIHGLFPTKVPILWESHNEGIIIEENNTDFEADISYEEIIDVLISDFYMNVHLYIGSHFKDAIQATEHYAWTKKCFNITLPFSKNSVVTHVDAVPYLFLSNLDQHSISMIVDTILRDTINEDELLHTVRTFLTCNSNATLAAKQLYMHRNSLQYRVDKFIEKTGIDVKQFHGGISVYLTLLLKQKIDKHM